MNKLIIAACFSLAGFVLSPAAYSGPSDVDPAQHVRRAGIMSPLAGTTLTPTPPLAQNDPERILIRAGIRNGQPGNHVTPDQRFRVVGSADPVRAVLSSGIMASRPYDFAPAQ